MSETLYLDLEPCRRCEGSGQVSETCKELRAKGERQRSCEMGCSPSDCPTCNGTGWIILP